MWTPLGTYLHIPASLSLNVSTPALALHNSICKSDLTKPLPPHSNSHIPLQLLKDIRNVHKHKYVTGLVGEYLGDFYFLRHSFLPDATIRSLCEIWNLHGIHGHKVIVKLSDFGLSACSAVSSDMDSGSAPYMSYSMLSTLFLFP